MDLTDRMMSMTADLQLLADRCRQLAEEHKNFGFSSEAKTFAERCDAHLVFCKGAIERAREGDFTDSIRLLISANSELWDVADEPAHTSKS
jgi:hypothetical protein